MLIQQNFKRELPPRAYLTQAMDGLCKTYVYLWDSKDESYKVSLEWKKLTLVYQRNNFRGHVRKLHNLGLLNYSEDKIGIYIELTGWADPA